jgi:hypothetical protein
LDRSEVHTIPLNIFLALYFLQEEDFLQSNLLQRGGKRPQEERRSCFCRILLFGGGFSVESCSGGIWSSAERGISRRANSLVLLRRFSIHAEHHVGVLLCGKSS